MTARLGSAAALLAMSLAVVGCAYEPPAEYVRVTPEQYAELAADPENVSMQQEGEWTLIHKLGALQAKLVERPGEIELKPVRIVTGWYTIRTDEIPSTQPQPQTQPKEGS